jgi:hypothetical protein
MPDNLILLHGLWMRGIALTALRHRLAEWGGAWLLGHSQQVLEHGLQRWDGPREAGMVAGRMPVGLGAMLGQIDGEHDGTVALAETQLPGLTDHCTVEASHTGLLFSAAAAAAVVAFLQHGRFAPL